MKKKKLKQDRVKNKAKDQNIALDSNSKLDNNIWITFLVMLVLIPLTVKIHPTDHINPIVGSNFMSTAVNMDLFSFYKYVLLLIATGILIMFFLTKMISKGYTIKQDTINIPLFVFLILILLSTIFAEYKYFALVGMYNRYESALAFLCYGAIFLIAANITYTEKKITYLIRALYPIALANAVLGSLWFYRINIMDFDIVRNLLIPSTLPMDNFSGHILATFPNPNYLSGTGAVLCLIFLTKAVFDKNIIEKVINVIFSILSMMMVLTSLSTSGFVTIVILIPVLLAFVFKSNIRKNALITLVITLVLFSGILNILNNHNERVWAESLGFFTGAIEKAQVKLETKKQEKIEKEKLAQETAEQAEPEPPAQGEPKAEPSTEGQADVESPKEEPIKEPVEEVIEQPLVDIATEFNLPERTQTFGSGRGYIWAETLKLIKQKPILGYGLDTYTFHFPQNDPNRGGAKNAVDKPHNLYLDIAYSSGVFALMAFLVLIVINIYRHFKIYLTGINTNDKYLMAVLFMGWSAFLVQWLFNDTRIGTTFIFWIIFGVSISLIRRLNQGFTE